MSLTEIYKEFIVNNEYTLFYKDISIRYYKLGKGRKSILFLIGGIKKSKLAFETLILLSKKYSVFALDYPPLCDATLLGDIVEYVLHSEGLRKVIVVGQSYGSIIAQWLSLIKPDLIEQMILSGAGPLVFTKKDLMACHFFASLIRVIPAPIVMTIFKKSLLSVITFNEKYQHEYLHIYNDILRNDVSKDDIYSFYEILNDMGICLQNMNRTEQDIPVTVLYSENDPTQNKGDEIKFRAIYPNVRLESLGKNHHTAYLYNPELYTDRIHFIIESPMKSQT